MYLSICENEVWLQKEKTDEQKDVKYHFYSKQIYLALSFNCIQLNLPRANVVSYHSLRLLSLISSMFLQEVAHIILKTLEMTLKLPWPDNHYFRSKYQLFINHKRFEVALCVYFMICQSLGEKRICKNKK